VGSEKKGRGSMKRNEKLEVGKKKRVRREVGKGKESEREVEFGIGKREVGREVRSVSEKTYRCLFSSSLMEACRQISA
jgi:hypothetical protein